MANTKSAKAKIREIKNKPTSTNQLRIDIVPLLRKLN